jgi:plastocyanin
MSRGARVSSFIACGVVLATIAACDGGNQAADSATPTAPAATDTADGPGIITGRITFDGTPPAPRPLPMDADPKCTPEPGAVADRLLVGPDNGLKNVFVHVKDGLGNRKYAVPTTPVMLDQKGCQYVPHVFGVQVGQPVQIANSDPTMHNVNSAPRENRPFNFGQVPKTPAVTRTFAVAEIGVPFRCDVHSWMNAYAGVVPHPFFAVTSADGTFEIKGLPPGTYTIEAWHEQLGTQSQSVIVDGKTPATFTATFKPS